MSRFLVVDDDHATVRGIVHRLIDGGHVVCPFTKGAEAVDALRREWFDAVISNLEMPGVDGYAVARTTRECQPQACLVIVSRKPGAAAKVLSEGGACFVAEKPLDYDEVVAIVTKCRSQRGRSGHGACHAKSMLGAEHLLRLAGR